MTGADGSFTISLPAGVSNVDGPNNKAPYHGKAAEKGATCSEVAKMLGWSEDVWVLSGDMPLLR